MAEKQGSRDKSRKKNFTIAAILLGCAFCCVGFSSIFEGDVYSKAARAGNSKLKSPIALKAFLVGADEYKDLPQLPCVKNDVVELRARLLEIGFEPENITTLKTGGNFKDYPTKDIIDERFGEFVDSLNSGDFVVVFLAGHGFQPTDSPKTYLAPVDIKWEQPFATAVSIDKMLERLKDCKATFRWVVVDACRNDPATPDRAFLPTRAVGIRGFLKPAEAPDSVYLLRSCQPGAYSYEGGVGKAKHIKNGFLTLSLLEALAAKDSKADDNCDDVLSFVEMLEYVSERTDALAKEYYGKSQKPDLAPGVKDIDDFALINNWRIKPRRWIKWTLALLLATLSAGLIVCETLRGKGKSGGGASSPKDAEERKRLQEALTGALSLARLANAAKEKALLLAALALALVLALVLALTLSGALSLPRLANASIETTWLLLATATALSVALGWTNLSRAYCRHEEFSQAAAPENVDAEPSAGARRTLTIEGVEYAFRFCPPGVFMMGSPTSEEERKADETQRRVTLTRGFWLLETPVTQEMWAATMGDGESPAEGASYFPAEGISWEDSRKFIEKLNALGEAPEGFEFRLPSEAEWEYACRAGTTTPYFWGSTLNGEQANCNGNYPYGDAPKGDYRERASESRNYVPNPWGLYDMHGNVCEWCEDWFGPYDASDALDPTGPSSGSGHVLRGGCWKDEAKACRSANRERGDSTTENDRCGFRLVVARKRKE
ncbi:MAG: SUMF1/EgtB/PvdO family nonheme iron enzyme [Thermoguttaceae bacterium]|nr:SUMF1/EgtB/PvdO family nonheme iron enzyme [Thermoguttaceae bacterium]